MSKATFQAGLAAGIVSGMRFPMVVENKPNYPTLAPSNTWYRSTTPRSTFTEIRLLDSYEPASASAVKESWAADADETGSVMCYVEGSVLTIAGNGSGKIMANPDSSSLFGLSGDSCFSYLTAISGLELLDTGKVWSMREMFYDCYRLTAVDVSKFDTSNVVDMSSMFWACKALTELDVSNFDTSKVTDMNHMFYICEELSCLNLSNFNTSNAVDMSRMFMCCFGLTAIYVGDSWDTSNANVDNMFHWSGVSSVTHV